MRPKLLTMDYIFFYISLFLIIWMGISYWVDTKIENNYASTLKVRTGYEVRDYIEGVYVGDIISFNKIFWWKEIEEVKERLQSRDIGFVEYPYFIRENENTTYEVFFRVKRDSEKDSFEGLSVALPMSNTAFSEFKWYPTKKSVTKAKQSIISGLSDNDLDFNMSEIWIEIKSPFYTIPFMMKNGVFIDIIE